MVADEDRLEPGLLGQHREIQQFARPELLGRRLVSEFQQGLLLRIGENYTLASTSSRKRRMLPTTSAALAPSKLKSTATTPRSLNARKSPTSWSLPPLNRSRVSSRKAGLVPIGYQPSPSLAVRRRAGPLSPPTQIGTRCCTG